MNLRHFLELDNLSKLHVIHLLKEFGDLQAMKEKPTVMEIIILLLLLLSTITH